MRAVEQALNVSEKPLYTAQPRWTEKLDLSGLERKLQEAEVISIAPMATALAGWGKSGF